MLVNCYIFDEMSNSSTDAANSEQLSISKQKNYILPDGKNNRGLAYVCTSNTPIFCSPPCTCHRGQIGHDADQTPCARRASPPTPCPSCRALIPSPRCLTPFLSSLDHAGPFCSRPSSPSQPAMATKIHSAVNSHFRSSSSTTKG